MLKSHAVRVDGAGLIVSADDEVLAWLGLDRSAVVGHPFRSIFDVDLGGDDERLVLVAVRESVDGRRGERGQRRLEILLEASTGFTRARDESEVAELLSDVAKRSYAASHVSVHLLRDGKLSRAAGENPLEPFWPQDYQPTGGRTLLGREVLVVRTPAEARRYMPDLPIDEIYRAAGIHAALSSPILYGDEALGAMICFFDHPREFDDEAAPLATALTTQAAQALSRIRVDERTRRSAMMDAVTGLPGRRLFEYEIDRVLEDTEGALCVIFVDLDRFKKVNDELGHAVGDDVLRQVGRRLENVIRKPDAVGRFGGDEFVVVAAVDDMTGASALAHRILDALTQPYNGVPATFAIGASLGVVVVDGSHDLVADSLLRAADHEMYAAKAAGRGRVSITMLPAGQRR